MNNRIPRRFNRIIGEMLIDTSHTKTGDIIHVYKSDFGYLALNTRTNLYIYMFVSMIRNGDIFRIISIER